MNLQLPKHIGLTIEHQPHEMNYETVEQWLEWNKNRKYCEVAPEDEAAIIESGEIWGVQWYPDTPVGFYAVAAATLDRALELARQP